MKGALSVPLWAINLPVTLMQRYHNGSLSYCSYSDAMAKHDLIKVVELNVRALTERLGKKRWVEPHSYVCSNLTPILIVRLS